MSEEIVKFRGRPPGHVLFTPKRRKELCESARQGLVPANAGPLAGVPASTLNRWLREGEDDPDGPYGAFSLEFRKNQALFKKELLDQIRRIGVEKDQWAALMTILERVFPEEFKRPAEGANVTVNIGKFESRVHDLIEKGELKYGGG